MLLGYIVALSLRNFDRIVQVSIINGLLIGYYGFRLNTFYRKRFVLAVAILLPIFSLLFTSAFGLIPFKIYSAAIFSGIFYTCVAFGIFITKLPIDKLYQESIILGLLFVFFSALTRKLQPGTSASITIFLAVAFVVLLGLKTIKPNWIAFFILIGMHPLTSIALTPFPDVFVTILVAISIGIVGTITFLLLFFTKNPSNKWFIISMTALIIAAVMWFVQENFEKWFMGKNIQTEISENIYYQFEGINGRNYSNDQVSKKKLVVLFWSAYCSNCYKEYPYFSSLAQSYSSDTSIAFLAVFLYIVPKDSLYFNTTTRKQFAFEWAKAHDSKKLMQDLKINGVPQMTIFDYSGAVVYNGVVSNRPWLWVYSPRKYLNGVK